MTAAGNPISAGFISRVQNILMKPKAEWQVIEGEPATPQSLFIGYACVLAAIPAIARIISGLFPYCALGICVTHNLIFDIVGGVVDYIISLAGVYLVGVIINLLAPNFGGQPNQIQALKVAVYSFTAVWLAGIFAIYPLLAPLGIVGAYSAYLLYLGLPALMKSPADKSIAYTIVAILCSLVVFIAVAVVGTIIAGIGAAVPAVVAAPVAPAVAVH
jgi:hypothetical protein